MVTYIPFEIFCYILDYVGSIDLNIAFHNIKKIENNEVNKDKFSLLETIMRSHVSQFLDTYIFHIPNLYPRPYHCKRDNSNGSHCKNDCIYYRIKDFKPVMQKMKMINARPFLLIEFSLYRYKPKSSFLSETVSETISEAVSETTGEAISETISEAISETTGETVTNKEESYEWTHIRYTHKLYYT